MNDWVNKKYLLYGMGIGNSSIKKYFDTHHINYQIYDGNNELDYDILIKSSGIPPEKELVTKSFSNNKLVLSDLGLYSIIKPSNYNIGITGSNGKTTTSTLIYNILKTSYDINLCGNIGLPIFDYINDNIHVVECSSFMLDNCYHFRPNIYIILNIEKHHLDYHKTYNQYIKSKLKCLSNMKSTDYIIYNYDDKIINNLLNGVELNKLTFSHQNINCDIFINDSFLYYHQKEYLKVSDLMIKNKSFLDDISSSILVSKLLNINDEIIKKELINFRGLPHRFEIIFQNDNLIIINDSKATNPQATLKAFESVITQFSGFQTLWIGGGKICNEEFYILKNYLSHFNKIYLFGENRHELENIFKNSTINCLKFPSLNEVIDDIFKEKLTKQIILFSPSSPSLDQYKSFEERGEEFKKLIKKKCNLVY